ncbi:hypothetical protein BT93_D0660 [Corymbia citriodora subsp. variegata]|nr:hypothetical protein BT93_D0660 [Corymbia citriodora subsp. variegata]
MSEDVLLPIRSAILQVLFLPKNEQRRAFWPKSRILKFKRETERKRMLTSFVDMIPFNSQSFTVPKLMCSISFSMFHLLEDGSRIATFTKFAFVIL